MCKKVLHLVLYIVLFKSKTKKKNPKRGYLCEVASMATNNKGAVEKRIGHLPTKFNKAPRKSGFNHDGYFLNS